MKNLMNLGKALNKQEQKTINGGGPQSEICADWPNMVFCTLPRVCTQYSNGSWYCAL